jgi:hypothetical protein
MALGLIPRLPPMRRYQRLQLLRARRFTWPLTCKFRRRIVLVVFVDDPHSTGSGWLAVAPNAPLLKDSDSFTDGTGHSTFDFNLPANGNDIDPSTIYPLIYHPKCDIDSDSDDDDDFGPVSSPTQTITYTNSLALDLLPRPSDRQDVVRAWVEGVSAMSMQAYDHHLDEESQQLRKRRRSLTASSEAEARRVRAWTPTKEPSHAPQPGARMTYPARRQELEAPD